jgi:hypothetical protein
MRLLLALGLVAATAVPSVAGVARCGGPAEAPPPVELNPRCEGASPGMGMTVPSPFAGAPDRTTTCPMGFFYAGSDGHVYATMAGHCHLYQPSTRTVTYPPRKGPLVLGSRERRVGEVAFARFDTEVDFGLVRLFRGISHTPQQCYWGGPTRLDTTTSSATETVRALGTITAHQIVLREGRNGTHRITSATPPTFDSASLVTGQDGALIGHVTRPTDDLSYVHLTIERPMRGIALAEKALRITLRLMTAPVID